MKNTTMKSKENIVSKQITVIKRISALALVAVLAFAAQQTMAQNSTATPAETSPMLTQQATSGPISHTFTMKKIDGTLNLLVDQDGTWNFSGSSPKKFSGKDFDVTLALKNSTGAIILFEWSGDASNGIEFSKQGKNSVLKENFASFAAGHKMSWDYRFSESAAGRAKLYAERQAKKEKLEREKQAAKKAHDEKLAKEKAAELKTEEQEELSADFGTPVNNLNVTEKQEKSYEEWRASVEKQHLPLRCPNNTPSPYRNCILQADINGLGFKTDEEAERFEKLPPALQKETGTKAYELMLAKERKLNEQARKQQEARQAQQKSSGGGGGGSSVLSTIGEVAGIAGAVLSFL
jgi:hypothetical protein